MGPALTATALACFAIVAAFLVRPRVASSPGVTRAALFWLVAPPILFLTPSALGVLILCGLAFALLAPPGAEHRAVYYWIGLIAIPVGLEAQVPFPGINFLLMMDFPRTAALLLLAPAIFLAPRPLAARHAPATGVFLLLLTLLLSALDFRNATPTNALRSGVYHFLLYALPFMALIRLLTKREDFPRLFGAWIFVGIAFFFTAVVSELLQWNFYNWAAERFGALIFADVRYGMLRIAATQNAIVAGFMMALAIVAVEYFRSARALGAPAAWIMRGLFLFVGYLTFSRGAWLAIATSIAAYFLFTKVPRGVRPALLAAVAVIALPAAISFIMTANLSTIDDFGTFEYRRELLRASLEQIGRRPFFGDPLFLESDVLQHLYQGQGIIDVVNMYLQIALQYGLVGLGLFVAAFAAAIAGLLSLGKRVRAEDDRELERQRAALLAAMSGYLVMIATTSGVSIIPHIGVGLLAFSVSFVAATRLEQRRARESAAEKIVTGDLHE